MARDKFSDVFVRRLDDIEREARSVGSHITEVCEMAKISRATPDRWRANPPKTIRVMDDLEAALAKVKKKKAPAAR